MVSQTPFIQPLWLTTDTAELDKLKLSLEPAGVTPDGDVTTGDLAKAATRWLLDINRIKKEVGHGAIRLQKWSEHLDKTVRRLYILLEGSADQASWSRETTRSWIVVSSLELEVVSHYGRMTRTSCF